MYKYKRDLETVLGKNLIENYLIGNIKHEWNWNRKLKLKVVHNLFFSSYSYVEALNFKTSGYEWLEMGPLKIWLN